MCASQSKRFGNGPIYRYVYDAGGARIGKTTLTTGPAPYTISGSTVTSPTCAPPFGSGSTTTARYLVDQGGNQATELNGSGTWQHSNVWAGGKLVATYDTKGIHFQLTDPLGSKRVQVNAQGQVDETCTSLPFGNDVNNPTSVNCVQTANSLGTSDDATENHFTGKERDAESGNDYFEARYYSSAMGRFMSPDWSAKTDPVPYAVLDDPQSLNLYAYVRNNPLVRVDPDGHCAGFECQQQQDWIAQHQISNLNDKQMNDAGLVKLNNSALAGEASNAQGSTHWDVANKTKIAAGRDKCNEFAGDMIEGVGRQRPKVKYKGWKGLLGMTRDPSAKEWATEAIPGYSAPMPVSSAEKGDIVAVGHPNDEHGHVGIYVGGSGVASANWYQGGTITINNWGFRPAGQNDEEGGTVVVRKWLGNQ